MQNLTRLSLDRLAATLNLQARRASSRRATATQRRRRCSLNLGCDWLELEHRRLLATFSVINNNPSGPGSWFTEEDMALASQGSSLVLDLNVTLITTGQTLLLGGSTMTVSSEAGHTFSITLGSGAGLTYEEASGTSSIAFTGVNFVGTSGSLPLSFEGKGMSGSVSNATISGFGASALSVATGASLTVSNSTLSSDYHGATTDGTSTLNVYSDTFSGGTVGVYAAGTVNVNTSTFNGGLETGIYDSAALSLSVSGSTFTGLVGTGNMSLGCGIDALDTPLGSGSSLVVNTSTFTGNTGGYTLAIDDSHYAKQVLVENSTFTNNSTGDIQVDGGADGGGTAHAAFVNNWEGNSTSTQPNFVGSGAAITLVGCMWSGENDQNSPVVELLPNPGFGDYYNMAYCTVAYNSSNGQDRRR